MRRLAWLGVALAAAGACRAEDAPPAEQRELEPERPVPRPLEEQAAHHQARADAGLPPPPPPPPSPPQPPPGTILNCFAPPQSIAVPGTIHALAVADFDGDERDDVLVVWGLPAPVLALYRGGGDGTLVAPEHTLPAGFALAAGDLDGDGDVDAVAADAKRVLVFDNPGTGAFVAKRPVSTGRKPYGVRLADLDGDGKLDLHVELFDGVQLYRGIKRRAVLKTKRAPDGPVVADFDGDGHVDLGYASNDDGVFFTLKGKRGAFKPAVSDPSCESPHRVSGGDFDDDGDVDIAYGCADAIELRLGDGKGGFAKRSLPVPGARTEIIAADFTRDGKTDLVVAAKRRLVLLAGDGAGAWPLRAEGELDTVWRLAAGDFDGDGHRDLVVDGWDGQAAALHVLLGRPCLP